MKRVVEGGAWLGFDCGRRSRNSRASMDGTVVKVRISRKRTSFFEGDMFFVGYLFHESRRVDGGVFERVARTARSRPDGRRVTSPLAGGPLLTAGGFETGHLTIFAMRFQQRFLAASPGVNTVMPQPW